MDSIGITQNGSQTAEQDMRELPQPAVDSHRVPRMLPIATGAGLACYGITRRSLRGTTLAVLGGAVAAIGVKAGSSVGAEIYVHYAITINRPRHDVYEQWRHLEDLPRSMKHVQSVEMMDDQRSHWTADGPLGRTLEWEAETTQVEQDTVLAWRSIRHATVPNRGTVRFSDAPHGRGTQLELTMICRPPAGPLGNAVARLTGRTPQALVESDLRRFKAVVEGGEAPTTSGQPAGARSAIGRVANAWAASR